jgi:hypothetical protein
MPLASSHVAVISSHACAAVQIAGVTVDGKGGNKDAVLVLVAAETERQMSWSRLESLIMHWAVSAVRPAACAVAYCSNTAPHAARLCAAVRCVHHLPLACNPACLAHHQRASAPPQSAGPLTAEPLLPSCLEPAFTPSTHPHTCIQPRTPTPSTHPPAAAGPRREVGDA